MLPIGWYCILLMVLLTDFVSPELKTRIRFWKSASWFIFLELKSDDYKPDPLCFICLKRSFDEMKFWWNWWNEVLMKWSLDEMKSWWNEVLMKWSLDEMKSWWNEVLMKWSLDEMKSWWNEVLMKFIKWTMKSWCKWNEVLMKWSLEQDFSWYDILGVPV